MSKKLKVKVPVGEDGFVPTDFLIAVDEARPLRARTMDHARVAGTVFTSKVTKKQAEQWMNRPNRYDIEGVAAPAGTANVPVGGFPRRKPRKRVKQSGTSYPQSFWDSLDFANDPVGASRLAAQAMEVEKHGLHDDARSTLEDDAYEEVAGTKWRHDDTAAAEAMRDHMMDEFRIHEMDMANANRKRGRRGSRGKKMRIFNRNEKDYNKRKDLESPDVLHPAVLYPEQFPIYDARFPRASCWETCGECETEFVMAAYHPEACPHCGMAVLPCNMCDTDVMDCRQCPYSHVSGTRIGVDHRTPEEMEDDDWDDDDDDYYGDDNKKSYQRRRRCTP